LGVYKNNAYSAPTRYGHQEVLAKGHVDRVEIVCRGKTIAVHTRCYGVAPAKWAASKRNGSCRNKKPATFGAGELYQVFESLTLGRDFRIGFDMIHHGNQCFEGLPCLRQFHFGLTSMQSVAVMGQASYPPPAARARSPLEGPSEVAQAISNFVADFPP
jgi:hypothetical protein